MPSQRHPRAVVFDLDDTLYPERAFAMSGFEAIAAAFQPVLGDPEAAANRMRELFDTEHGRRIFDQVLSERGYPEDPALVRRMIDTYHAHPPRIGLHADADACLTRLRDGFELGLISDGLALMQRNKVHALGLTDRLDEIILTGELGRGIDKPHPRAFEMMAQALRVAAMECVYVADNPRKDFIAPNVLGWMTVRVLRADGIYRDEQPSRGGEPVATITTLDDLDRVLRLQEALDR